MPVIPFRRNPQYVDPPHRPYNYEDMQTLRAAICDAVQKWSGGWSDEGGQLYQLDVQAMALDALSLSILDLISEGESGEALAAIQLAVVDECKHLIELESKPSPQPPNAAYEALRQRIKAEHDKAFAFVGSVLQPER
jgi:hypothetical protein